MYGDDDFDLEMDTMAAALAAVPVSTPVACAEDDLFPAPVVSRSQSLLEGLLSPGTMCLGSDEETERLIDKAFGSDLFPTPSLHIDLLRATGAPPVCTARTAEERASKWQRENVLCASDALHVSIDGNVVASKAMAPGTVIVFPTSGDVRTHEIEACGAAASVAGRRTRVNAKALATVCATHDRFATHCVVATEPGRRRGGSGSRGQWAACGMGHYVGGLLGIRTPAVGDSVPGTHQLLCACSLTHSVVQSLGLVPGHHQHLLVAMVGCSPGRVVTCPRGAVRVAGANIHDTLHAKYRTPPLLCTSAVVQDGLQALARRVLLSPSPPHSTVYADASGDAGLWRALCDGHRRDEEEVVRKLRAVLLLDDSRGADGASVSPAVPRLLRCCSASV